MRLKLMAQARKTFKVLPRWRIYCGEDIAVGPGKVELLAHVKNSGSLMEAAKAMDMSYMRAWLLMKTMNRCFKEPLVILTRGGKHGGGAKLTVTGERALALYEQLEKDSLSSTRSIRDQLIRLMKK
jgi:molybdate transport system regulatory protein